MIILLSLGYERTTDEIIDYFLFYKKEFLRINCDTLKDSDSFSFNYKLNENATTMKINNVEINLDAKKVIWNRRISKRTNIDQFIDKKFDFDNLRLFSHFVFKEWEAFLKIFVSRLSKNTFWFDYPFVKEDKIDVLLLAQKNGLTIPDTIISNKLDNINNYYITKPLYQTVGFKHGNMFYSTYTTIVKKVKHKFLPSLFQKKIDKRYEVRTFYLDGKCYSMAIFSQSDKQTAVDFRQYNYKKPNRTVPYKLPNDVEDSLRGLMKDMNLKTGSIDIIRGKDDKYYFLEVNPVGQFGMTSKPCNYNLEKKVFEKLIEYEQNF